MSDTKLRWGILSTASIANKNWEAILNSGNGTVTAVASRDLKRSQAFIDACQTEAPFPVKPQALGRYQDLIASDQVDAVYIPLPTGLRKEWVLRAAEAGKHVICEKPCGDTVADVKAMVAACREHKVQFMDGVMFMHSQRMGRIRDVLDDGEHVGRIKRLTGLFSFCAPEAFLTQNIRMHSGLESHGCLGDLGWYCIRFFLWALHYQMPTAVTGRFLTLLGRKGSPTQVPAEFSAELFFENGVTASFYASFLTEHQQLISISGDKGQLIVDDFVLPFLGNEVAFHTINAAYTMRGCEFTMERYAQRFAVREYSNNHPSAQETNLFRNFADQIGSGLLNEEWPEIALKTQRVLNACRASAEQDGARVSLDA